MVIDDIKINSKLTLGEDVADLGGLHAGLGRLEGLRPPARSCAPRDGLTPEQRFFVGYAQWACANERAGDHARRTPAPTRTRRRSTASTAWW